MLEINKTHEITSKSQAFEPQILYKTTHGKKGQVPKIKHNKAMDKKI